MSTPQGLLGGISLVAESVFGTDPSSGYSFVHAMDPAGALKIAHTVIEPKLLGNVSPAQTVAYDTHMVSDGFQMAVPWKEAVAGPLFKNLAAETGAGPFLYDFDDTPDTPSLCVIQDYGEGNYAIVSTGCMINSLEFVFEPGNCGVINVQFNGASQAEKSSPPAVVIPLNSYISMPGDLSAFTVGGTAVAPRSFKFRAEQPLTGADRKQYGSTAIKQPIPAGARFFGCDLTFELDDATGEDTVAELNDVLGGTDLGDIVATFGANNIITLGTATALSGVPDVRSGVQEFTIPCRGISFDISILS